MDKLIEIISLKDRSGKAEEGLEVRVLVRTYHHHYEGGEMGYNETVTAGGASAPLECLEMISITKPNGTHFHYLYSLKSTIPENNLKHLGSRRMGLTRQWRWCYQRLCQR